MKGDVMTQYTKLFEPGKIGKLELKNRIILPPMVAGYTTEDGLIPEQMLDYYAARARGGCGLVIVEAAYPRRGGYPPSPGHAGRINLDSDRVLPSLRRLAEVIHTGGAKAVLQLNIHRGRNDELDPASAIEAVHPRTGVKARAMTVADLKSLGEQFGDGAKRAREAGFEAMMIHGGSGYLVSEFLSPRTNKRTDEYGGDAKKRARFALELLAASKEKAGADYPVMFRMTADERVEGGFVLEDAIILAKLLEEAGIDAIDIVSGVVETYAWVIPYMYMPRGCNADLSLAIKKVVKVPVSVAGRINDPDIAEEILREGKADFVGLGRTLIADPEFPNKVMEGKVADICMCVACGRCIESILKAPAGPMICTVNPAVGKEKEFELGLKPAAKKKKVLVIGGGPGGMEAAIIAAQRGHDVTLWEKEDKLGGQLNIAIVPPGKEELGNFTEYLSRQVQKLQVTVKTGKEATVEAVSEFSPDAVILAAGSKPLFPKIKGIEGRKVLSFRDVLAGKVETGKRVIVIGGGFVGCETADFLAEKGKKVTVVEILPELASEIFYPFADLLVQRLKELGVETFIGVKEEEITDKGVNIVDKDGKKISLEADDIVIATGSVADKTLFESLKGKVPELHEAGDCVQARRIYEAVSEGATAAMKI